MINMEISDTVYDVLAKKNNKPNIAKKELDLLIVNLEHVKDIIKIKKQNTIRISTKLINPPKRLTAIWDCDIIWDDIKRNYTLEFDSSHVNSENGKLIAHNLALIATFVNVLNE